MDKYKIKELFIHDLLKDYYLFLIWNQNDKTISNRKMALFLLLNLKIILLTAKHMNNLDAEEMAEVEKLLLLE